MQSPRQGMLFTKHLMFKTAGFLTKKQGSE
jgi:hypothetical protein